MIEIYENFDVKKKIIILINKINIDCKNEKIKKLMVNNLYNILLYDEECICIIKYNESSNKIISFIILRENGYDLLNDKYEKIYTVSVIYTFNKYRREKHASDLLNFVKTKYNTFSILYNNEISNKLFKKCSFFQKTNNVFVYPFDIKL